jgi:hypothetical protein
MGLAARTGNPKPWLRWCWVYDPFGSGGGDGQHRVCLSYVSTIGYERQGSNYRRNKLEHSRVYPTHDPASQ